ncbi:hypothetical protein SAMN05444166_1605 [Singulisphaera sp. GP187]|uniref:hypothetical protein n=1 Tax=Singulisphaera sp. GP187 TaxID=1882752 RepID=UPI00092C5B37|nr:hypothetical protein [Singulisphaera sp. GP187]SIN91786.1 hypothetical protein SAMN05444166_1605 [Singulisphaera sp. GP187]
MRSTVLVNGNPRKGISVEVLPAYGTAALIIAVFLVHVISRKFDPFAPIWMFLVGYVQIYVFQAINYHDWAMQVRGPKMIMTANLRALWALALFLVVYHCGFPKLLSKRLPNPPTKWSTGIVCLITPFLFIWGSISAGLISRGGGGDVTPEGALLASFPFVMLVAAALLIVTGQSGEKHRPAFTALGLLMGAFYILVWMFNGKRSHSLMGVLVTVCAFYISRLRRPSWPVLISTAFAGALAVSIAIGWRFERQHGRDSSEFLTFLSEFDMATILRNMNIEGDDGTKGPISHETEEYGAWLVIMTAVPSMSEYDYGASYLRIFSTFIPRIIWPSKPYFGREQWINAWIAGSEYKRDSTFTGPAIGIHGATHLNGGAWGTAIVFTCVALFLRTAYDYFRLYGHVPWVQAWWSVFFFNAWFMVVTDDPLVWFYYNWGFTSMPFITLLWFVNKWGGASGDVPVAAYSA